MLYNRRGCSPRQYSPQPKEASPESHHTFSRHLFSITAVKSAHADKKKEKINQAKSCQEKLVSFSLQKQFQTVLLNLSRNDDRKIPWKNSWGSSTYALLTFHIPLIANETSTRNHETYGNHLHSANPSRSSAQILSPFTPLG